MVVILNDAKLVSLQFKMLAQFNFYTFSVKVPKKGAKAHIRYTGLELVRKWNRHICCIKFVFPFALKKIQNRRRID